ncbi:MAG: protein kinase [Phycisphaerales bacterium]|nr:protein kinase [Phycisphaerales bacterium]
MTPEQYNKVQKIFLAACEKPAEEQSVFVQQQAANNNEILQEVQSLLREHRREVQLVPSEPVNPLSAILSRANIDPDDFTGEEGEASEESGVPEGQELPEKAPDVHASTVDAGRFTVGAIVADRYRIIELLGRGGMGEVYRADDTTLNQSVALKFLPALFSSDEKWLARFRDEVRLARLITHTNVCRVFDIGTFQGEQFISMEYVDGENLASLLRRIGRLPNDKALQIARQLCAGLAAAHDRGVLHRDLKPANVMIDGRGHVRITDFGLAVPIDQFHKGSAAGGAGGGKVPSLRVGTPAYMAPEQFAGKPVTVRSDIYALGLLLYEMFTGHRAFKGRNIRDYLHLHSSETPTPPSEIIEDIDPIVERVIFKCLEKDPNARPASAMAVSAALPGGDPLRAILAAGETPSPEVVAAAGESHGGLKLHIASAYLLTAIIALICFVYIAPSAFIIQRALKPQRPLVPASPESAIKILQRLGYTETPRDRASSFALNHDYYDYVDKNLRTSDRWQALLPVRSPSFNPKPDPQLRFVYFWYRQSPEYLIPLQPEIGVQENDPPQLLPGMVRIRLDQQGTLIGLQAQPPFDAPSQPFANRSINPQAPPPADWYEKLLDETHLNAADLRPVPPQGALPVYARSRIAYDGTLNSEKIHVEAAEYQGRPVFFSISGPAGEERFLSVKTQRQIGVGINIYVWTTISVCLLIVGAFLVWRNYHSGKGDRVGALRLAFAFAIMGTVAWLLRAHHVFDLFQEYPQFQRAVGANLFRVGVVWIFYLALEPYVRRIWPEIVISWNRVIAGKWFDPLVGRDILIGATAGSLSMLLHALDMLIPRWLGLAAPMPDLVHASRMVASLNNFSALFSGALSAIFVALGLLLLIVVLRMALRNKIAASIVFILLVIAGIARIEGATYHDPPLPLFASFLEYAWRFDYISICVQAIVACIFLFILIRHGLVALFFCLLVRSLLLDFPITHDFAAWYAKATVVPLLCILLILLTGFYATLGGKSPITLRSP